MSTTPGKNFANRTYFKVHTEPECFRKKDRAEDQATRIRRSGYYARVIEEKGVYSIYACTKSGRPIPKVWKKIQRRTAVC